MRGKFILTIILFCITFTVKAEGYRISVNWEGLKDTTIFLAQYRSDTKIYVHDTLKLDNNGKGVFNANKDLQQGLYVIYLNDKTFFDVLIGADQNFSVETNNTDFYKFLKIKGSQESENFLNYQEFLRQRSSEKSNLEKEFQQADSIQKKAIRMKFDSIDKKVDAYLLSETLKYPGTMYGLFMKTSQQLFPPELAIPKNTPRYDSIAWFYYYNFNRDHFLDNIDFSDERILYTPLLQPKLDAYFNKILIQSPDSVIPQALKIINRSKSNKHVYQYVSQFLLNNSLQSKIMGIDAVFVTIADSVYLNGNASWTDTTTLRKVAEEAYLIRPTIIGKVAPELVMENVDGQYESLHQIQSLYTILVIWNPTCGHCKKEIPDLYQNVYMKYLNYNIDVFAVNEGNNKKEWTDFINDHQLVGWHHVWDVNNQTRFRLKYNVKTTPLIYLLDKDKKIIAKKIDNPTLIKLLDTLLKK